ncbi:MAG: sterol desaturase family protein [Pedobacter sp.]|nr:MAG: sterol desaturase family protein [Pedobacter sp.]
MEHSWILAMAIPLFLFFIGLEYYYSKKKQKNFFHFAESIANLNVGIAERLTDIFTVIPFYYFFKYIHTNYALFDFKEGLIAWVLLFLLTDLVWYWYHRLAHEVNLLWAAHIVHHQSEDFNYTVSARITIFQATIRSLFWGILPLLGFSAEMITSFLLIHGLYPFFIHTQTIGKLGWIEYIFVTPSHHRVHHSSNPAYLDKNYGDVLIIWDKLFGSFTEEKEQPVYGLTKPLNSHSFLWQHFHYPLELLLAMKKTRGLLPRMKILFGRPDTIKPDGRSVLERFLLKRKQGLLPTAAQKRYIIFQTGFTLTALFCIIFFFNTLSLTACLFISLFILLSVVNTGAILEQRSWIFYLEFSRLSVIMLYSCWYFPHLATALCMMSISALLLFYFRPMERQYKRLLYQPLNG